MTRVKKVIWFLLLLLLLLHVLALSTWTCIQMVSSFPIQAPDLRNCVPAVDHSIIGPPATLTLDCCLNVPLHSKVVEFSWDLYPPISRHVREAAHRASPERVAQYIRAYELLRALPDDDPRGWLGQANLHCAFCNAALKQAGFGASGKIPMQVHFSWIFLPWHRLYLYFHERILASLVGDPSFSLVFWNWDDQVEGGNLFPDMFSWPTTSLYDIFRDPSIMHNATAIADLVPLLNATNPRQIVLQNLNSMYRTMVCASIPELFVGGPYRVGTDLADGNVINAPLGGSIENSPHNAIHLWVGDRRQRLNQDMGTFTTAARDPIFFAHHANIDRLWAVWETIPGGRREHPFDPDFLEAEFPFFDEHANLVKVKVRDALDNAKLGVSYPTVPTDEVWMNFEPVAISIGSAVAYAKHHYGLSDISQFRHNSRRRHGVTESISLGDKFVSLVRRWPENSMYAAGPTNVSSSSSTTHEKVEVLVIEGLHFKRHKFVHLVVFVNLPDANHTTPTTSAEYVGSFNVLPDPNPHKHVFVSAKFAIGDNIRRIGLVNETEVVITVLVKPHGVNVKIRGIEIVYL